MDVPAPASPVQPNSPCEPPSRRETAAGGDRGRTNADPDLRHRNGFPPLPETLVVSCERSGHNLLRHVVESLVRRRTPGVPHLFDSGELLFHRTHCVHSCESRPGRTSLYDISARPRYGRLMLLLRDPREIFVRSYGKCLQRMLSYCWNLAAYDRFVGPRLLVVYDALVSDDDTFARIFDFLGVLSKFDGARIPLLRREAVAWYDRYQASGGGSLTKGSPELLAIHQQQLTPGELASLHAMLRRELGADRMERYLGRWLGGGS